ncbi:MAG: hypothetical protein RL291_1138 [Pseudomonadota bacterium]
MRLSVLWSMATSPKFRRHLREYNAQAVAAGLPPAGRRYKPMLDDATANTGFDEHYVYHTAWATRILAAERPAQHVDVSSSLYFVALASAIVPVVHLDYRPAKLAIDGVTCIAGDLMNLPYPDRSLPSLSCMHVVEHVGLGRYGDPIDALGDRKATAELQRVVAPGGMLLFVTPVGRPQVMFNAHRIYPYEWAVQAFSELKLEEFSLITDGRNGGELIRHADPALVGQQKYGCGCYLFRRPTAT